MSLDLDDRQRAMLLEMGVHVWWPQAESAASLEQAPAAAQAVRPALAVAIENIVVEAINTPARASNHPKSAPVRPAQALSAAVLAVPSAVSVAACEGVVDGIAAMDWPTLAQTVASCQACKLCIGRRAPVFAGGDGPRLADWLVVTEPPEEIEERAGRPQVEQAGQLLDNMLRALGISRQDGPASALGGKGSSATRAYVTSAVKCRPARVRNPSLDELAVCGAYLRREVALVQPKVILAMGRFAAQALLQGSVAEVANIPLGKLRGQLYRYQGLPVVVTYPPVYLLRSQHDKARAWADLCLAQEAANQPHFPSLDVF
jgi:DNA polymerase